MEVQRQSSWRSETGLTRRGLIRRGVGVAAAAAFPYHSGATAGPMMDKLSVYMSEASSRPIPALVLEETKYHVLDTLAAMISGSQLPPGRQALRFARAYGGAKTATIVAS